MWTPSQKCVNPFIEIRYVNPFTEIKCTNHLVRIRCVNPFLGIIYVNPFKELKWIVLSPLRPTKLRVGEDCVSEEYLSMLSLSLSRVSIYLSSYFGQWSGSLYMEASSSPPLIDCSYEAQETPGSNPSHWLLLIYRQWHQMNHLGDDAYLVFYKSVALSS